MWLAWLLGRKGGQSYFPIKDRQLYGQIRLYLASFDIYLASDAQGLTRDEIKEIKKKIKYFKAKVNVASDSGGLTRKRT